MLRRATPADLPRVTDLLAKAKLPLEGLVDQQERLWVLEQDGRVVGAIAFEAYRGAGLLRSLVVDPGQRGHGFGKHLLSAGIEEMRKAGLQHAYGLTTTIPDLLARMGWTEVTKQDLPAVLNQSMELRGACPDTARAFHLELT